MLVLGAAGVLALAIAAGLYSQMSVVTLVIVVVGGFIVLPLSMILVVPWRYVQSRLGLHVFSDFVPIVIIVVFQVMAATHSEPLTKRDTEETVGHVLGVLLGNLVTSVTYWRLGLRAAKNDELPFLHRPA